MPPIRSLRPKRRKELIRLSTMILSLSEIIPSYSRYTKKGLIYVTIAAPSGYQPSSYTEYIKANVRLSYDVRSISNTKYTRYLTLRNLLVPYLIYYRVLSLIYY